MKMHMHPHAALSSGRLAVLVLAACLLPITAQETVVQPAVTGRIDLDSPTGEIDLSLQLQATLADAADPTTPTGAVFVEADGSVLVFEVTGLETAPLEVNGVIAGSMASLSAVDRQTGQKLEARIFDEDSAAAGQLAAGYHAPFPPGDCVTFLQIGETEYEVAALQCLATGLKIEVAAQPE